MSPESLYTLMYLSDTISLINSLNLFSKSDFEKAININEKTNIAEISININPNYRNKKLSESLLRNSIIFFYKQIKVDLLAAIKKNNLSSIQCFKNNGFVIFKEDSNYNFYIKKYSDH